MIPTINSGDKVDSKTIDMIIVPYDNTVSDPITVNITELNVKVEAITESDSTDKEVTSLRQGKSDGYVAIVVALQGRIEEGGLVQVLEWAEIGRAHV